MGKIFYINVACNQRCVFCLGVDRSTKSLEFPLVKGFERLVISGGETTLAPDIFKVLKFAKKNNIRDIELQTNAITLEDFDLCRKLLKSGVQEFNINMPAHVEAMNDRITLAPGSFKRRLAGLKNLFRLGAYVRLTFVIHQFNYRTMPAYCRFIKNNFPQVSLVFFGFVQIEGAVRRNTHIVPRLTEVRPYLIKALNYAKKVGLNVLTDNIPLCILGEKYFYSSVNYNKSLIRKANLRVDGSLNLAKRFIAKCRHCVRMSVCGGIRSDYLKLYGENEFKPFA